MADIATRLRTFCLANSTISTAIGTRMSQGMVPETIEVPYVWFGRQTTTDLDEVNPAVGLAPFSTTFDLEVISDDLDEAQTIADAFKSRLNNYRGAFADSTVKGIFASDHNDQYIPRSVGSDDGRHIAAIQVEVIP